MTEPQYRLEGIVHTKSEQMEDFEGPLDVIFLLLSKNKIEIEDVSISAILEQYLAYLDEMKRLDMEIASEFITMASHLMLIKTKMLLSAAEQQEAQTELDLLRQSLIERQRKEVWSRSERLCWNWSRVMRSVGAFSRRILSPCAESRGIVTGTRVLICCWRLTPLPSEINGSCRHLHLILWVLLVRSVIRSLKSLAKCSAGCYSTVSRD